MVNHDVGSAQPPDPLVWSAGALSKRRMLVHAVMDYAMLPGPPAIWASGWVNVPSAAIVAENVAHWPYSSASWLNGSPFGLSSLASWWCRSWGWWYLVR